MEKHLYLAGACALVFAVSVLPAASFAEGEGGGDDGARAVHMNVSGQASSTRPSIVGSEEGGESEGSHQSIGAVVNQQEAELETEDEQHPATSVADLKQKMAVREQQLAQELASTTPADKNIVANANPVRLAVHNFLSSKTLLGGIGPEVSQIAKQISDSVATTTNVEAQIQSRGFFTRLLFGGDTTAANELLQQVSQNDARIVQLTDLLNQANLSASLKTTLAAQVTALQAAQTRLKALAQKEQSSWGLFSWRF